MGVEDHTRNRLNWKLVLSFGRLHADLLKVLCGLCTKICTVFL